MKFKKTLAFVLAVLILVPSLGMAVDLANEDLTEEEAFISEVENLDELLDALESEGQISLYRMDDNPSLEIKDIKAVNDKNIEIELENVRQPIVVEMETSMEEGFQEAMNNGNAKLEVEKPLTRSGFEMPQRYIRITFEGKYSEYDIKIPLNIGEALEIVGEKAENDTRTFRLEIYYQSHLVNIDINIPINLDKVSENIKDKNEKASREVEFKIEELSKKNLTLEDKRFVKSVRADYENLSSRQKKLVRNLYTLELLEDKILQLEYEKLDSAVEVLEETIGKDFHNREIDRLRDVTSSRKRREVERRVREIIEVEDIEIYIKREHPIWNNKFEITLSYGDASRVIENVQGIFGID